MEKKTRKAKHIDHYVGPATIVKRIGSRSFQISFTNPLTGVTQLLQRDAGMIILKKERIAPSLIPLNSRLEPARHQKGLALRVGEMVIMLDYPESKDWYVAEVFITIDAPLAGYRQASTKTRVALKGIDCFS